MDAIRGLGATVRRINEADLPDLLVGFRGKTYLFEVKDGKRKPSERKLRPGQQKFFDEWRGGTLAKIESVSDVYRILIGQ